eukprot:TRINITY_DN5787_c0_g1_i3.p3 TRINITY_DN5787_c0_g1~~TRINITY_DN5787_c0_g1_i3.p3  ORF type:complete len:124 (+),score=4.23 TRINITY_DN5787_c0_g1_i3:1098-1469(+)
MGIFSNVLCLLQFVFVIIIVVFFRSCKVMGKFFLMFQVVGSVWSPPKSALQFYIKFFIFQINTISLMNIFFYVFRRLRYEKYKHDGQVRNNKILLRGKKQQTQEFFMGGKIFVGGWVFDFDKF